MRRCEDTQLSRVTFYVRDTVRNTSATTTFPEMSRGGNTTSNTQSVTDVSASHGAGDAAAAHPHDRRIDMQTDGRTMHRRQKSQQIRHAKNALARRVTARSCRQQYRPSYTTTE